MAKESESNVRKRAGGASSGDKQKSDKPSKAKPRTPFEGRYNPKFSDKGGILPHSVLSRLVMVAGVVVFVWWTSHRKDQIHPIAKVDDFLEKKKFQNLQCSPSYKKEIEALDPACLPSKCGRFVVDGLVTERESHALLAIAKKGMEKGGGAGGATIMDLHSGALSQGDHFINVYKSFPDLFTEKDFSLYNSVKNRVKTAISEHFNIEESRLYLTHPTFFSELTAVPPVTIHDEYWHPHIDKQTYPTFHYTSLLYLADYNTDFTGGRFMFMDSSDKVNRTVEPKEGRVSAFTSDMNRHFVEPVEGGARYALTMGFTCDSNSAIADPGRQGRS